MLGVIAGDSLVVRATTWLGQEVETTVRLLGVDTLELRAACGEEWNLATRSRAFTAWLVETGAEITLSDIQLGKFAGRGLALVVTAGGVDIGQALIDAANKQGGHDNITVVVAIIGRRVKPKGKRTEKARLMKDSHNEMTTLTTHARKRRNPLRVLYLQKISRVSTLHDNFKIIY